MSKIKNPTLKKQLSLSLDRRNVYRENSKSSRKNIARGKQRRHMDERRAVGHLLRKLKGQVDDDFASEKELQVKVSISDSKNRGFRKVPDKPLGAVLELKRARKGTRKPEH
jgi:hypothetical protein